MNQLISLLKILYACNLMAEQAPPSQQQAEYCVGIHDRVKLQFLTKTEIEEITQVPLKQKNKITLRGYDRFKQWEVENPELVQNLREAEKHRLGLD
ncbi:MAG: hypothetical protein ABJM29_10610 [Rhizobiaceae bacterium]